MAARRGDQSRDPHGPERERRADREGERSEQREQHREQWTHELGCVEARVHGHQLSAPASESARQQACEEAVRGRAHPATRAGAVRPHRGPARQAPRPPRPLRRARRRAPRRARRARARRRPADRGRRPPRTRRGASTAAAAAGRAHHRLRASRGRPRAGRATRGCAPTRPTTPPSRSNTSPWCLSRPPRPMLVTDAWASVTQLGFAA